MTDDEFYMLAKNDVAELVDDVISQLEQSALDYNYEFRWVITEFRSQFNAKVRELFQ